MLFVEGFVMRIDRESAWSKTNLDSDSFNFWEGEQLFVSIWLCDWWGSLSTLHVILTDVPGGSNVFSLPHNSSPPRRSTQAPPPP